MRNYLVDPEHLNVMLWAGMSIGIHRGAAVQWKEFPTDPHSVVTDVLEPPTVNYVGQMLLDANAKAVGDTEPRVYGYRPPAQPDWSLLEVLAAIQCYETQSRHLSGWYQTRAHAFCRALELAVLRQMVRELPSQGRTANYHLTAESVPSDDLESRSFPVPQGRIPAIW